ncbi:hypothetical protein F2Q70_00002397 [Brassica cretica]|uniref:Uncharacterized protein n=1 Tax=Brassica cretica TaxID=69181 RepID=A0A8S9ISB5_BRACR|nr:hypothetical protein F2Q70_00002397 [Brassica cretica]
MHWDIARNPHLQCARGLTVGVKNGYDEVNVQIPEEEKRRKILRQIYFRNRFFFTKNLLRKKRESSDKSSRRIVTQRPNTFSARSLRIDRVRGKAQSLHSDQTPIPLGRYVATELEPKFDRYVATELLRNVDTTSVHAFSSTL